MYNQPNPLVPYIRQSIGNFISQHRSSFPTHILATVDTELNNNIQAIVNHIQQNSSGGSVPPNVIDTCVSSYGTQILNSVVNNSNRPQQQNQLYNQQPQQNQLFGQQPQQNQLYNQQPQQNQLYNQQPQQTSMLTQPQAIGATGMLSTPSASYPVRNVMNDDIANTPRPVVNIPKVPQVITPSGKLSLVKMVRDPTNVYQVNDMSVEDCKKYSTSSLGGEIIEVIRLSDITDKHGVITRFSDVTCNVHEDSITKVINNFHESNPKLLSRDRYMANLRYYMFKLFRFKSVDTSKINVNVLTDTTHVDVPVVEKLTILLKNIEERNFSLVNALNETIVPIFNDISLRYLRSSQDINVTLQISHLPDIIELATMRSSSSSAVLNHKEYPDRLLRCVRDAVSRVIGHGGECGYFNHKNLLPDLISSEDFIVRGNGYCERDCDITNEKFSKAVIDKYTIVEQFGDVMIANFIPDELDIDIKGRVIDVCDIANVFDLAILDKLPRRSSTTILAKDVDKGTELCLKYGETLERNRICFEGSL